MKLHHAKTLVLVLFLCGGAALLFTNRLGGARVAARSTGPAVGHTGAPGERDCAECHLGPNSSAGTLNLGVPRAYVPGQTYDLTVTHATVDQTRKRWGFQLTALDDNGQKAGTLVVAGDGYTQVLNQQEPFPMRQYIEHTAAGTFRDQLNGATWTFRWTAPATDVGNVTFYAAGNQANSDGSSAGDNIFFTFVSVTPAANATQVQFALPSYTFREDASAATLTVTRTGDLSVTSRVAYRTIDDPSPVPCAQRGAVAYARCDYATTLDTLVFAPEESSKTISVPLIDDAHPEDDETFRVELLSPMGAALGATSAATVTVTDNGDTGQTPNPVFASPFFVRQHYLDFLSREPESTGFAAWLRVLDTCPDVNDDVRCDRLTVSGAFFGSDEFRLKGVYVFLFYRVAFDRRPSYAEIVADLRGVTGADAADVYARRAAFAESFAQRPDFRARYDALTPAQFVAMLLPTGTTQITTADPDSPESGARVTLTRDDLTNRLTAGARPLTRGQVLRAVVQSQEINAREGVGSFVAMQYYGYLRRDAEPTGYQAWVNYLSAHPGDYRTMVNGFVNSREYRLRFGQP